MMKLVDALYFWYNQARFRKKNRSFQLAHPAIKLPPPYMVYESYRLDYESYYRDGYMTAKYILHELGKLMDISRMNLLDWGCGPARVVRHMPALLSHQCHVFATDYNPETVRWCRENISGVEFRVNSIQPPLGFDDRFFDAVYGISIFTHLSDVNHELWMRELHRILKPGGILLITTQGPAFKIKMNKRELAKFNAGELVVRSNVKEGHRTFSAFQPHAFMDVLLGSEWNVLKKVAGGQQPWGPEQDTWMVQKR